MTSWDSLLQLATTGASVVGTRAIATFGVSSAFLCGVCHAVGSMRQNRVHPLIAERTLLCARCPEAAVVLSQLCDLDDAKGMQSLLDLWNAFAEEDARNERSSQWRMARLMSQIIRAAHDLAEHCPKSRSDDMYCAYLVASHDTIPKLEELLQSMLHNHLVDRM